MSGTVAIVQARMGSTRLPGKVMMPLAGRPVIDHVIDRVSAAPGIDAIVLATTTRPEDDALAAHVAARPVAVHRGSDTDVLARFDGAARMADARTVVRITADDPVKDPDVIGTVVAAFGNSDPAFDYVSNTMRPTWPEGQDTEVFSAAALYRAAAEATDPYDREHVTPYFYRNPDLFRCHSVEQALDMSSVRLTLDTPEDFLFFETLFDVLGGDGRMIRLPEILELLAARPEIVTINAAVTRSAAYR